MKKFIEIQGKWINIDHIIRVESIGRSIGLSKWHPAIRIYTIESTLADDTTKTSPLEFWVGSPQGSEKGAIAEAGAYLKELLADSIISPSHSIRHRS